jgi:hypothetical protein
VEQPKAWMSPLFYLASTKLVPCVVTSHLVEPVLFSAPLSSFLIDSAFESNIVRDAESLTCLSFCIKCFQNSLK